MSLTNHQLNVLADAILRLLAQRRANAEAVEAKKYKRKTTALEVKASI